MKNQVLFILLAAAALPLPFAALTPQASAAPVYVGVEGGNVAVSGYDAVSYFDGDGVPVKGDADFAVAHDNAVYHFANGANAARFAANPEAFMPRYGGHCAWAMSRGYLAPGDPLAYAIVDGKLYLNFNQEVKAKWDMNRAGYIAAAETNWAVVPADAKFGG
ncbi:MULTISPECIES: YHS domain-containing (seleno)protein [unclassified Sphingopyxis]|uniref:YHS domain-containing (seleno)protein n=1 Tax=unclassified Sphingopyxis TaxID=2614943 RepID=UPI0028561994|nr:MULTISPECIES: YHS domain-containing (seleno)protein [unclassified Sphingopyxis]MDR6832203.1 YHS domain-containing protein [Sphingopyxis sp. BE122]MDR7227946.1 YHS domain-containing protein [Sphingopyxis sp. BE259]